MVPCGPQHPIATVEQVNGLRVRMGHEADTSLDCSWCLILYHINRQVILLIIGVEPCHIYAIRSSAGNWLPKTGNSHG